MKAALALVASLALLEVVPLVATTAHAASQMNFSIPPPIPETLHSGLSLWATYYYVHSANELKPGISFNDKNGKALTGSVSPREWCLGAIEGTIQVRSQASNKTVNYAGSRVQSKVDCASILRIDRTQKPWIQAVGKSFFSAARGLYGDGVAGYVLVPFRTIAVDPTRTPIGSVVYVPDAKGTVIGYDSVLPIKHDGYLFAADKGDAIKGSHIDVFCGSSCTNCFPSVVYTNATQTIQAFIVNDSNAITVLKGLHNR